MKTKYFIFAASALVALASCSNDEYIGDNNGLTAEQGDGSIQFSYTMPNATRADIYGDAAATLLGSHFYVTGTKGTEDDYHPTEELVFDNYLVEYGKNTAGTTASNTANWEYAGITPGTSSWLDYTYLTSISRTRDAQTIKYWDYSKDQYDFLAFSTGTWKAVASSPVAANKEIGVTAMNFGAALDVESSTPSAYTFTIPSEDGLAQAYITDIVKVPQANFNQEVKLTFKSLGSKVRVALYETIPGYSVKDVQFYRVEGAAEPTDLDTDLASSTDAILISPAGAGIPTNGTISVFFPHVGTTYTSEQDYNKATATVSPGADPAMYKSFGALQYVPAETHEGPTAVSAGDPVPADYGTKVGSAAAGSTLTAAEAAAYNATISFYLGRTLPTATFAGDKNAQFYKNVFPISTSAPLILRVNYTLVPTDGAAEIIKVKGAKAVVPSTYTKWLPNYAYTYIFKISDNTNGWTGAVGKPAGLFPITFDAVVTEATDATAEQRTVTTVSTPSITTYQQYHMTDADEYSKKVKDLEGNIVARDVYVQVMDNSISPAKLIGTSPSTKPLLNTNAEEGTSASRLFKVTTTGAAISEATVMDALENRTGALTADDVTGRNGITLTKNTNIDNTVVSIVNGVDNNPIEKVNGAAISGGQVAKITIGSLDDNATYAYVYDYTGASTAKELTTVWQPIATVTGTTVVDGLQYIAVSELTAWDDGTTDAHYTNGTETVAKDNLYFSISTNGGATKTYSFISVDNKIGTVLPAGMLKIAKTQLHDVTGTGVTALADTFYFTTYIHNTGLYAVKVIKVVPAPAL